MATKRSKKQPLKFQDNALKELAVKDSRWCKIVCLEDNKTYNSPACKLESLDGLGLSPSDIKVGGNVIWHYHGDPYEVTILEVHEDRPSPKLLKSRKRNAVLSSEESDVEVEVKKKSRKEGDLSSSGIGKKFNLLQVAATVDEGSFSAPASEASTIEIGAEEDVSDSSISLTTMKLLKTIQDKINEMSIKLHTIDLKLNKCIGKKEATIQKEFTEPGDPKFVTDAGINLLNLRIKYPDKYALALLDALFNEKELAESCYKTSGRSKKKPLNEEKVDLLEEVLKKVFGETIMDGDDGKIITRKCNQKCLDQARKRFVKLESCKDHEVKKEENICKTDIPNINEQ